MSPSLFLLLCLHAAVVTVVSLLVVVVATVMNWRLSWPMEKVPARRWRRLWRPGPVSIMQLATLKVKLLMNAKWAKGCRQRGKEERREGGGDRGVPPYSYSSMGSISVTSAQFQLAHCGQCQFICNSRGQVARLKFAFHSILFRQRFWPGLAWPGCKCAHYAPRCCACLTMTLQTLQLILNPNSSLKPN